MGNIQLSGSVLSLLSVMSILQHATVELNISAYCPTSHACSVLVYVSTYVIKIIIPYLHMTEQHYNNVGCK